jgi:hypothetical protein
MLEEQKDPVVARTVAEKLGLSLNQTKRLLGPKGVLRKHYNVKLRRTVGYFVEH